MTRQGAGYGSALAPRRSGIPLAAFRFLTPFRRVGSVGRTAEDLSRIPTMAVAPLLTDRHRPHSDRPLVAAESTPVTIPVQRGSSGLVPVATRPAGLHAAPR